MSRERLPRAENDLFSRHSQRIVRARQVGELDYHGYALLSFLVDLINLPGSNGEKIFTLEELAETLGWPLRNESLRKKLHELRREGGSISMNLVAGREQPGSSVSAGPRSTPTEMSFDRVSNQRPLPRWKLIPTVARKLKPQTRCLTAFPASPNLQLAISLEQSREEQRLSLRKRTTTTL